MRLEFFGKQNVKWRGNYYSPPNIYKYILHSIYIYIYIYVKMWTYSERFQNILLKSWDIHREKERKNPKQPMTQRSLQCIEKVQNINKNHKELCNSVDRLILTNNYSIY